jgi:hypothetical protein
MLPATESSNGSERLALTIFRRTRVCTDSFGVLHHGSEIPKLQEKDGVLLASEMKASINPTAATRKAVRAIILPVHPFASTVAGSGANIVPFFVGSSRKIGSICRRGLEGLALSFGTDILIAVFLLLTFRRHRDMPVDKCVSSHRRRETWIQRSKL